MMWPFGGLGMIWMLLFWAGIIVLVVWAVRFIGEDRSTRDASSRALEILEERYARGEIDTEEFRRRRSELESGR